MAVHSASLQVSPDELQAAILLFYGLLEHDTAGDPITGLRWSRRTTTTIAEELATLGIAVSANTTLRRAIDAGIVRKSEGAAA